ncbi:hypothetical protein COCON_G00100790 [Conger conger]|uniref:Ig-like domain-containing protein n=1 Tax=Conger conger TaxID=82655 RepID=A0A9Q1DHH5_CONCO|nr:hypothetical protein COCON_G00100790 [Conger conger]
MKSIFSVFLLLTSAVRVYGQVKELQGIVGRSMVFPAAGQDGRLFYNTDPIAVVTSGVVTDYSKGKYVDRLHWDSSTGFSLSGLKMNDKGLYKVVRNNGTQSVEEKYQLTMYVPVSKPNVSVISDEYPCKLMCTVERGTDATLTWYREGEHSPYDAHPPRSAPDLYLSVPVEKSGTYTCEAKNSVSTNTSDPLTVGDHCTAPGLPAPTTSTSGINTGVIVASVLGVVLFIAVIALIAVVIYFHRRISKYEKQKQGETAPNTDGLLKQGENQGEPTHL